MVDPSFALSVAYATLLSGLTYQDKPVVLYDQQADDNAQPPYVILGPWQGKSDNTKDSFGQTGEINLDVVTRFVGNTRSRKPSVEIANLITTLLKPTTTAEVLNAPGFKIWNTVITGTQDMPDVGKALVTIRKIITIQHRVWQSN